ncbi:hypothetical protein AG1IA_00024 [Rhizoctonia solani AG-1 IA]|uniref:Uncharacterized protein n=1 Tax=Thanatephorus cucumeris (strain AG1-IA) TaxID=983506 RepID=L8XA57_THACA|nr:hypothetical protein AG1IA_00024 [Rhizoctonia solani AG-1 IA]
MWMTSPLIVTELGKRNQRQGREHTCQASVGLRLQRHGRLVGTQQTRAYVRNPSLEGKVTERQRERRVTSTLLALNSCPHVTLAADHSAFISISYLHSGRRKNKNKIGMTSTLSSDAFVFERNAETGKIRINVPARYYLVPGVCFTTGLILGLTRGARQASLRFLAENAHRRPTTVQGWYFYKKTKNYRVMWGALKGGGAVGLKMAGFGALWVGLEQGSVVLGDKIGGRTGEWIAQGREMVAGVGSAGLVPTASTGMGTGGRIRNARWRCDVWGASGAGVAGGSRGSVMIDRDAASGDIRRIWSRAARAFRRVSDQRELCFSRTTWFDPAVLLGVPEQGISHIDRIHLIGSHMLKLWPSGPSAADGQLTPRASDRKSPNPFEASLTNLNPTPMASTAPRTPTVMHHLLKTQDNNHDTTPLATPSLGLPAAAPTTQLSLNPPEFKLKSAPPLRRNHSHTPSIKEKDAQAAGASSRGQLHVKLIAARGLNVSSARP